MTHAAPAEDKRARDPAPRRGLAPIAQIAARVAAPLLKKRGLAQARVLTEWPAIVGPRFAARSMPERLVRGREGGGVLRLRVPGVWALEFQHLAPVIVERVNAYLGYTALARIVIMQGPLPRREPRPEAQQPLAVDQHCHLAAAAAIEDPELRERLISLGRAVLRRAQLRATVPAKSA